MFEYPKRYDLEDRTLRFSKNIRAFVKKLPRTIASIEDGRQLIRSSGSVGANYIEANEALSRKDFLMRIKICRKEARESRFWLSNLELECSAIVDLDLERAKLAQEAKELTHIFGSIVSRTEN